MPAGGCQGCWSDGNVDSSCFGGFGLPGSTPGTALAPPTQTTTPQQIEGSFALGKQLCTLPSPPGALGWVAQAVATALTRAW